MGDKEAESHPVNEINLTENNWPNSNEIDIELLGGLSGQLWISLGSDAVFDQRDEGINETSFFFSHLENLHDKLNEYRLRDSGVANHIAGHPK